MVLSRNHAFAAFVAAGICLLTAGMLIFGMSRLSRAIFYEEFRLSLSHGTYSHSLELLREEYAGMQMWFLGAALGGLALLSAGIAIIVKAPKGKEASLYQRYQRNKPPKKIELPEFEMGGEEDNQAG